LQEYVAMFALTASDLQKKFIGLRGTEYQCLSLF